ncbi:hypothetical protein [Desulfosarcina ovata]|uniref:Zinc/iron-chelating domain-containing protein n=1 Tax=Desulfosarcina ovata subsp. ovata TaxID=2752305 RepID=A0A5K8A7E4_9BACT|nr:hypothetical protein [Desulfosarcina ovata]BBO88437.1 hypothetical protein DSCOOX_16170 [Desulfosarcina ovata subsp. ovata]
MGLNYQFREARKKLDRLDADERRRLLAICQEICQAQAALTRQAAPILAQCMTGCQGLCCRNIHVADIITGWDLIYILALAPQLEPAMAACLAHETFFPADCLFLKNGVGPCLFPDHLRPERCVISFCRVEPSVEKEIAQVMRGFSRLIRFFRFRPLRRIAARLGLCA